MYEDMGVSLAIVLILSKQLFSCLHESYLYPSLSLSLSLHFIGK